MDLEQHKLSYQTTCFSEALRLDPPTPLSVIYELTADVKMITGQLLPKGTLVSLNLYALHKDPAQYHMAEKFKPMRFEKKSSIYMTPGNQMRHRLSWCPFQTGLSWSNDREYAYTISKWVTSLYFAAMPQLSFSEPDKIKKTSMPSSAPTSQILVKCTTKLPLRL